jgi:outer membrane beta-barrel protein
MKDHLNLVLGRVLTAAVLWTMVSPVPILYGLGRGYNKSTEGGDVVKNKIYPRSSKFEIDGEAGMILNQSYINTFLIGATGNYFLDETWGFSLGVAIGINSDKAERTCIESFYYDPNDEVNSVPCGGPALLEGADEDNDGFPRYGPAYVPIRELNYALSANLLWTPVYGKQLILLSATSYFDLFFELGLGLNSSTFYRKRDTLNNDNRARGEYYEVGEDATAAEIQEAKERNDGIGATVDQVNSYGLDGRPDPVDETNIALNFGVGQKFHFSKIFHLKVSLRMTTLVATSTGFENLVSISGGFGLRL